MNRVIEKPANVVAFQAAIKATRIAVRLKYSLMADAELNRRLPELTDRIITAIEKNEPLELTIGAIVDEV